MNDNSKFDHEIAMAVAERTIARLWILCVILVICLIGTNAAWIYYESQFKYVETSQDIRQDINSGDGDTTVIGIGDYNGENKADN